MCMPFLGKLFGHRRRQRNSGAASPRASLAPTPQQSNVTMQTTNGPSMNSSRNEYTVPMKPEMITASHDGSSLMDNSSSVVPQEISRQTRNEAQAVPAEPSASSAPSVGSPKPTSWWEYLGMNRKKKPSDDSL